MNDQMTAARPAVANSVIDLGPDVDCLSLEHSPLPLFITAKPGRFADAAAVTHWISEHRAKIDELVRQIGGVVLRHFPLHITADFATVAACFPAYQGGYQGGAAARRSLEGAVYEATQRSGPQTIGIHQEMFYMTESPPRIAFFARKVAEKGGETTICDMRKVTAEIPASIREKLEKHGIRNVRNFAPRSGNMVEREHMDRRGWDFAFYTDSEEAVEAVCRRRELDPLWHSDGALTVFNRVDAFKIHPVTGDRVYRAGIHGAGHYRGDNDPTGVARGIYESQKYSSGTFLGNGNDLTAEEENLFDELVQKHTLAWPWEAGDLMLLDNLLTGHGRNPFEGERATEVAMFD